MNLTSGIVCLHHVGQITDIYFRMKNYEGPLQLSQRAFVVNQAFILSFDALNGFYGFKQIKTIEIVVRSLGLPLCLYLFNKGQIKKKWMASELVLQSLNLGRLGLELGDMRSDLVNDLWSTAMVIDLLCRIVIR